MPAKYKIVEFEPSHLEKLEIRKEQHEGTSLIVESCGLMAYGEQLKANAVEECAYTLLEGDIPIVCSGIYRALPHIGEAWSFFSEDFLKLSPRLKYYTYMTIRKSIYSCESVNRVQATCSPDFTIARDWLTKLGLEEEGILKGYSVDGKDCVMFGVVI